MDITLTKSCNLSTTTKELLNVLVTTAKTMNNLVVANFQKKDLAKELNKHPRTITRALSQLEAEGLISQQNKRGSLGGTVIAFSPDYFNFHLDTHNPITNDLKALSNLREKLYPSPEKKPPKRKYRDKKIIAEEKLSRRLEKESIAKINDRIEKHGVVDESTFEGLDNPELCMKAYLVSRMFNAYTVIYFIERAKNYEEGSQEYQYYMRASGIYKAYNSMSPRFVGTQAFTIFKELVVYCQENEINPLAYLYSQFKLVDYMSQVHKTRKYAVPYVPSLMSDVAKEQHENSEYFIKRMRATTPFYQISKEKAMYTGADYPIIQSLLYAYTFGKKKLDAPLQDLTLVGSSTKEGQKLVQFYESTKEKIKNNSELLTKERETLNLFLDLQVANLIDDGSMNPMQYTLSFALQLMHAHAIVRYKELPEDHFYIFAGNQRTKNVVTNEEIERFYNLGKRIETSLKGNAFFLSDVYMLSNYLGVYTDKFILNSALAKFDEQIIPLDATGMLDNSIIAC